MDRFDYKVPLGTQYISSGLTPGEVGRPVAWGSKTSFHTPRSITVTGGVTQLIVEPAKDDITVLSFAGISVKYLQNGVYSVGTDDSIDYLDEYTSNYGGSEEASGRIRVVARTGSIAIKIAISESEVFVVIDGITVRIDQRVSLPRTIDISPSGDVLYDKVVCGLEESIDDLINKEVRMVYAQGGRLMPLSADKWYEPELKLVEDMIPVEDYRVISRKLTYTNTATAFYSDTTKIEKSTDAENWGPVDKVEYHGEDAMIFRSKDRDFALKFYDTNLKEFVIPGATTEVTGEIYKVGDNIGSYFSNDSYLIKGGSFKVESEGMTSVSVLGYLGKVVAPNVLSNGSFENGTTGWENVGGNMSIDPNEGRLLGSSLKMTAGSVGLSTPRLAVQVGETWRWEVWYKTSSDFAGSLGMRPLRWEPGGNVPGHVSISKKENWTKISFDWTVTAGYNEINMRFANSITAGSVWIDDVRLSNVTNHAERYPAQIDNAGIKMGKMHLYTFSANSSLELTGEEMYISAIGINLDHQETMDQLSGISQISYADEINTLQDGVSINGDSEYSILDLQWSI